MTVEDRAFERLRSANPAPVAHIENRPRAAVALATIREETAPTVALQRRPASRRWVTAVVAAIVVVLLIGLPVVLFRWASDEVPPATTLPPIELDTDAPTLVDPPGAVTGAARFDGLGTPLSLDLPGAWVVDRQELGDVRIRESATGGGTDGTLILLRATELSNPADPFSEPVVGSGLPTTDLAAWLDSLPPAIETTGRRDSVVGGLAAVRFDLSVTTDAPCGTPPSCAYLATNRGTSDIGLEPGKTYRVWWIGDENEPIVVVAEANSTAFLGIADAVVATIGFGETTPHPIPADAPWEAGVWVDAALGTIRLPVIGGLQFDVTQSVGIRQGPDVAEIVVSSLADVFVGLARTSPSGEEIETIDDAIALIDPAVESLTELAPASVGGAPARVFDLRGGATSSQSAGVIIVSADQRMWQVPANGRIWLAATERGVLVISAGSLEGVFDMDAAVAVGAGIADSLVLIDFPAVR